MSKELNPTPLAVSTSAPPVSVVPPATDSLQDDVGAAAHQVPGAQHPPLSQVPASDATNVIAAAPTPAQDLNSPEVPPVTNQIVTPPKECGFSVNFYKVEGMDWNMSEVYAYTTQPVLSSGSGNIEYKRMKLPLQNDEIHGRNLLNRVDVRTFLKDAGCAVLRPFDNMALPFAQNLIMAMPSGRITNVTEDPVWPVNPLPDSSLTLKEQVLKGPAAVTRIKPDVLRWRICYTRLGSSLTERLFHCFTSKYNIYLLPKKNSTDRTWARSIWECKYVALMHDWTQNGSEGIRDDELGYEHLPLLRPGLYGKDNKC